MALPRIIGQKDRMVDRRIQRTHAALAQAIISLAAEKDFAAITIAEIAERAGIGYATFFRHYRDKEELLAEVAESLIDDLLALVVPALLRDDTLSASIAICQYIDENRAISGALLAGGAEANVSRQIVARAIERAHGVDLMQPEDVPQTMVIRHAVTASVGLLASWLEFGDELSVQKMGAVIDRLVMRPIRARRLVDNEPL